MGWGVELETNVHTKVRNHGEGPEGCDRLRKRKVLQSQRRPLLTSTFTLRHYQDTMQNNAIIKRDRQL